MKIKCKCSLPFIVLFSALVGVAVPLRAQVLTSSNLPIFYIDTKGQTILDDPKIPAEMQIVNQSVSEYNGNIAIEIRGSSSQMFPKKQYGFELTDENGDGVDASLLNLPEEEDWILFAPYNDKSLMRDVLAYKMGRDMDRYAPRTKYAELVLNDEYQGVYVLIEKIKRNKNRVNINKLDSDENDGDDVTGGYIIKVDKNTGDTDPGWNSAYPPRDAAPGRVINFLYEYPDADDITPQQRAYIKQFISDFEDVLAGEVFADPVNGYAKYIDVDSFIDYLLINEAAKNVDAYRLSTFMYKQRDSDGGKLVMGPIWDFNLGFGNVDYCIGGSPTGFVLDFNSVCSTDTWLIPFWWERLLNDPVFAARVGERWQELRADKFRTNVLHAYVDSVANVLNQNPQQRNFQKWPVLGQYVWPNYYIGATYADEVNFLKKWINDRMNWIDNNIAGLITSAEPERQNSLVTVYPNPSANGFYFNFSDAATGKRYEVELYNAMGQKVASYIHDDKGNTALLGATFPSGQYFYRVRSGSARISSGKVIKLSRE